MRIVLISDTHDNIDNILKVPENLMKEGRILSFMLVITQVQLLLNRLDVSNSLEYWEIMIRTFQD